MTKKYLLQALNICVLLVLLVIFSYGLISIKLLNKKLTLTIIVSLIVFVIISILLYLSKKNTTYNIGAFLTLLLNIILAFEIYSLNNTYDYINNLRTNKYTYRNYEIYVQKSNTTYNKLNKLKNKNLGLLKTNKDNVKNLISEKIKINYKEYNNIDELCEGIRSGEVQAFIIEDTDKKELESHNLSNKFRVIYETRIKKLK